MSGGLDAGWWSHCWGSGELDMLALRPCSLSCALDSTAHVEELLPCTSKGRPGTEKGPHLQN